MFLIFIFLTRIKLFPISSKFDGGVPVKEVWLHRPRPASDGGEEPTQTLQRLVISVFKNFDRELVHDCLCQHQLSCSEQIRVRFVEEFWMESSALCVWDSHTYTLGSFQLALQPSGDVTLTTLFGKVEKFDVLSLV